MMILIILQNKTFFYKKVLTYHKRHIIITVSTTRRKWRLSKKMSKMRGRKFFVLLMLASVFITSVPEVTHACKPQIDSTKIVCMQNLGRSKKHKQNKCNNVMWKNNFLDENIFEDFTQQSKGIPFNDKDGVLAKRLRRKMFVKNIIGQVLEFFIREY